MNAYLGIDPGLNGAIVCLHDDAMVISDMPTLSVQRGKTTKRFVDPHALHGVIASLPKITACALEQVSAMPGQGATSMFSFGRSYGVLEGVLACCGVPYTEVRPHAWKKALQVPAGKDAARARASQLLPDYSHNWPLKKHDGRAEAALLARYAQVAL
ncbi:MAG: hypothetical protein AAF562_10080 [Pseudomonadota bacterium]